MTCAPPRPAPTVAASIRSSSTRGPSRSTTSSRSSPTNSACSSSTSTTSRSIRELLIEVSHHRRLPPRRCCRSQPRQRPRHRSPPATRSTSNALDELELPRAASGSSRCSPAATRSSQLIKDHLGVGGDTINELVAQRADGRRRTPRRARRRNRRTGRSGAGSLGHQAGQRTPDRSARTAGQRHPHRAAGDGPGRSATASTACCACSRCRRRSTSFTRRSSRG